MNTRFRIEEVEKKEERTIKSAIAVLLAFAWTISLLMPQDWVFAQAVSPLPSYSKPLSCADRIGNYSVRERKLVTPSPRSRQSSEIKNAPALPLNPSVSAKRVEGSLAETISGFRSHPISPSIAESKPHIVSEPVVTSSSQPASPEISITRKLAVLAEALINQKVKGQAALKQDGFMDQYLVAVGVELAEWMSDNENDPSFQNIFKKNDGPFVLVFLAMSPTSMHEYMQDLDLPSVAGDITEEHRLPVDMKVEKKGKDWVVETQGAYDLWLTFRINEKNEVNVTKE